jgi:hypothetical protein
MTEGADVLRGAAPARARRRMRRGGGEKAENKRANADDREDRTHFSLMARAL